MFSPGELLYIRKRPYKIYKDQILLDENEIFRYVHNDGYFNVGDAVLLIKKYKQSNIILWDEKYYILPDSDLTREKS